MKKIASFTVDHNKLEKGMYISRIDGDITTFDLRTRKPNCGSYMDSTTMHTLEHMFATFVRNSEAGERVIYFGPMGCRTGFYLLMRDTDIKEAVTLIKETLEKIVAYEGPVFGASRKECGNYLDLDLESAKRECKQYLSDLEKYNRTDGKYDD